MSKENDLTPLRHNQGDLRGKLARILVDEPTDEIDWPADLPPGTKTVVILDDTPNPHHTLRVHPPNDPTRIALVAYDQLALQTPTQKPKGMDPRRIALNRKHSIEMGNLFRAFHELHPDIESEVNDAQMTKEQEAAWTAYSAELLAIHQAERSALADQLEAEQNNTP